MVWAKHQIEPNTNYVMQNDKKLNQQLLAIVNNVCKLNEEDRNFIIVAFTVAHMLLPSCIVFVFEMQLKCYLYFHAVLAVYVVA